MGTVKDLMPGRVVVADVAAASRDFLTLALHGCGVQHVVCVHSGTEAFRYLGSTQQAIDCVVVDIDLPDGNGLQLLQAIRCGAVRNMRADMCVVLIGNTWSREQLLLCRELDVNGVLVKPITITQIHAQLLAARRRFFPLNVSRYRSVPLAP